MNWLRQFWKLLTDNSYSVKRASALLAVSAILSNVLGLSRNLVFYRLVPSARLDVYFASFSIPDLLFNLVIFGAVSSAFVPMASELLTSGREKEGYELTDQLLSWLTVVFTGVAVLLCIFMEPLMHLVVHGFTDPTQFHQSVVLSRILMVQSVFFAWSFTIGGFLNSVKRFSSYALAPLVYNVAIIAGGLLYPVFGITGMAVSVVVGALFHFSIQFRELLKTPYRPHIDLRLTPRLKQILRIMIPRSISQGMAQVVIIVYISLGSTLVTGSISIFRGMDDIQTMPIQIIGNSMAVALFPTLSAAVAKQDWQAANALLSKVFRASLYILIPAIVFAFVVRAQIVRLYFGIGHSSPTLTPLAINTFAAFLIGIIPSTLVAYLSRVFYALKDTRTPMILSTISAVIGIGYAYVAIHFGGSVASLAVADSILSLVQFILYAYVINKHGHIQLGIKELLPKIMSYLSAAILIGLASWVSLYLTDQIYDLVGVSVTHTVYRLFIQLVIATAVGLFVFLQYSKAVHKEELQWILKRNFSNAK